MINKVIGLKWRSMTEHEKLVYQHMADQDIQRYSAVKFYVLSFFSVFLMSTGDRN